MEPSDHEESYIRNFGTNHAAFEFWDNPEEDIYQDYLTIGSQQDFNFSQK